MSSTPPEYIPEGPLESSPGGGYRDPEIRREALAAVLSGVETGDWDEEVLDWLARLDDSTCRTVASLLWRCRLAGRAEVAQPPEGTVTEWAIRVADPDSGHTDESMPVASEEVARAAVPAWRRGGWAEVAVVSRRVGPWTEAPEAQ